VATLAAYLDRSNVDAEVGTTPIPSLRDYLGAPPPDRAMLKAWYGAAIDWCHEKLSQRDFLAADGFANDAPPDSCVIGVYEFVRVMYHGNQRDNVLARKIKTGAREEEYETPGTAGRLTAAGIAAWPFLEPYVEDPTLYASGGA
jgi:hypothetical protein